jgi:hypothetical protein
MKALNSLSFQIDARFARYALLTGAALIASKPAKASVIATLLTGADFTSGSHSLDLNNDGIADYIFSTFTHGGSSGVALMGQSSSFLFGGPLVAQMVDDIDSGAIGYDTGAIIGTDLTGQAGIFFDGIAVVNDLSENDPLFVGLRFFDGNGDGHFGFAEYDPTHFIGVAFETDVDASITTVDLTTSSTAQEPRSLEMLAVGAAGLELLRRRRAKRA